MKNWFQFRVVKIYSWLLCSCLVLSGCKMPDAKITTVSEANQIAAKTLPLESRAFPTLFIVGDSTVHNTAPGLVGWGDVIGNRFDATKISVQNFAKPGRSTRTFISQGWWSEILASARAGDFVIIQMGHNDSSSVNDTNRSRGTLSGIGNASTNFINGLTHQSETVYTYGWYLRKYIAEARDRGMTPVLCTSVSRLPQPGKVLDTTRYAAWAREVATAENVPLVDLNRRALDRWSGKTREEIFKSFFAMSDSTHFNQAGAELNAACVVEGIQALTNCALKEFLLPVR